MSKLSDMNAAVNKMADAPFEYGVNDCYIFTTTLIELWHGKDYTTIHRVYKNRKEAKKYIQKNCGIEAMATSSFGPPVATSQLQDGDAVAAIVAPRETAVGFVFNGHGLFLTELSVIKIPLVNCLTGWRIR